MALQSAFLLEPYGLLVFNINSTVGFLSCCECANSYVFNFVFQTCTYCGTKRHQICLYRLTFFPSDLHLDLRCVRQTKHKLSIAQISRNVTVSFTGLDSPR